MSLEPQKNSQESFGALEGCLVEGDPEQRKRQSRIRRRALVISISLQTAILAAIILVPLFSKTPQLALASVTPMPPYSPYRSAVNHAPATTAPAASAARCFFCPDSHYSHNPAPTGRTTTVGQLNDPNAFPDGPVGPTNDLPFDPNAHPQVPPPPPQEQRRLRMTRLDPAMLVFRVEPMYPALARQTHREGHVELHAIISTDGRIESLQAISGDVLFYLSALDAVRQWRYSPTILNGQAVEIDTTITVVYTMQH
jgi:periplasmic protein TonB